MLEVEIERQPKAVADTARFGRRQLFPVAHPYKDLREVPGTVFDVSYTPQTVRISDPRGKAASTVSDPTATFSSSTMLTTWSNRCTKAVDVPCKSGGPLGSGHGYTGRPLTVINSDRTGIADLIQNGTIRWKVPVGFGAEQAHYDVPSPPRQNVPNRSLYSLKLRRY